MKLILPDFYEDELFCSWLARVEIRNMFFCYNDTAKYMFGNPKTRVSFEFINALTPEFTQEITKIKNIPDIIQNHTMFPYYSRFWDKERKSKAYHSLLFMKSERENQLSLPHPKDKQKKMYYCPICVKNERNMYGEAYWHRAHQIDGVYVCHKHCCKLVSSDVIITTRKKYEIVSAELHIPTDIPETTQGTKKEILMAQYLYELLSSPITFNKCDVSAFLHSRLNETEYTSKSARFIRTSMLYDDYLQYWGKDVVLPNARALKELCNGNRVNPYTISQIAIMVGISAQDLAKQKVPKLPAWKQFDLKVAELNETGIGYCEIARTLNASPHLILERLQKQGLERNRIKKEYRPRKKAV